MKGQKIKYTWEGLDVSKKIKLKTDATTLDDALVYMDKEDTELLAKAKTIISMLSAMAHDKDDRLMGIIKEKVEKEGLSMEDTVVGLAEFVLNNWPEERIKQEALEWVKGKLLSKKKKTSKDEVALQKINAEQYQYKKKSYRKQDDTKNEIKEPTAKEIKKSHRIPKMKLTPKKIKIDCTENQAIELISQAIQKLYDKQISKEQNINKIMNKISQNLTIDNDDSKNKSVVQSIDGKVMISGKVDDIMYQVMAIMDAIEEDFGFDMIKERQRYERRKQ